MIKINLTPESELRNPLWFVPEVLVLVIAYLVAGQVVDMQLGTMREQVADVDAEISQLTQSIASLEPKVAQFKTMDEDIRALQAKLGALKGITDSIINRFRPIIILEHLQNLKTPGLWFDTLNFDAKQAKVEIKGESLDYLLVAEFITSIKATAQGEADPADIRTQVYFDDISLKQTKKIGPSGRFKDLTDVVDFEMNFTCKDRGKGTQSRSSVALSPAKTKLNF